MILRKNMLYFVDIEQGNFTVIQKRLGENIVIGEGEEVIDILQVNWYYSYTH